MVQPMDMVYVFGRGKYFKEKASEIESRFKIAGFLDNSVKEDTYDSIYDLPVYNPQKISELQDHSILVASAAYIDMWRQLKDLGVEDEKIIFANPVKPWMTDMDKALFGDGATLKSRGESIAYCNEEGEELFKSYEELERIIQRSYRAKCEDIGRIASLESKPVSRIFGAERGLAVDRIYIEDFIKKYSCDIKDSVMEIGTDKYMVRFGEDRVAEKLILHVSGLIKDSFVGNFETGEGLYENMVDCLICTQTLQYIYDLRAAFRNIWKVIRPGGVALITVPGIKSISLRDDDLYDDLWSFTPKSVERLCMEVCDREGFTVEAYGNAKIAAAYLYGLCTNDLVDEDYLYSDPQFPFIVAARMKKPR